ncbi:MAG: hypothetical protein IJ087_06535, partial [Eggerthellaceae bacterium]|nr:hypothetical protein [Eggerthellaceae bacterium]
MTDLETDFLPTSVFKMGQNPRRTAEDAESGDKKTQVRGLSSSQPEHRDASEYDAILVCKPEVRGSIPLCS